MAFDLASDVGRQIYRLRTLCLVRTALPSVHSGSLARLQEVGKILLALEADYSRAFGFAGRTGSQQRLEGEWEIEPILEEAPSSLAELLVRVRYSP